MQLVKTWVVLICFYLGKCFLWEYTHNRFGLQRNITFLWVNAKGFRVIMNKEADRTNLQSSLQFVKAISCT